MQSAQIVGMGRFFLFSAVGLLVLAVLLFFPIFLEADIHYDMNRKKFGFALYAYKVLKLIGGYVTTYPGGIALHISPKKAILKPYSGMDSDRKRFSFTKAFRIVSLRLTTETGAEYLIPVSLAHTALRTFCLSIGGQSGKIENNLWLTDGDELRISLNLVTFFNLFILLGALANLLKEKIKSLWQKKTKKSIT